MLAPTGTYNGQATIQLPINSSLSAGNYYLVVLADAGGVVNESDLTTQVNSAPITLSVAAAAGPERLCGDIIAHRGPAWAVRDGDLASSECRRLAGDRLVDGQRLPLAGWQAE